MRLGVFAIGKAQLAIKISKCKYKRVISTNGSAVFEWRRATVLNAIYDNEPPPRLFNSAAVNNLTKKTYLKLNR